VTTGTTTGVVERMLRNEIDLGIVSLPIHERLIDLVPLKQEEMVAIFSEHTRDLPAKVTPQYLLQHTLILEYARAHVRALTMSWLAGDGADVRPAMELDNLEAVRRMVAAGLGASVVPSSVVSEGHAGANVVARPLKPALIRTLALAQRRDKPDDPALAHVRDALLSLAEK
jgi:DNA-binding transcriptional LysR family regulator